MKSSFFTRSLSILLTPFLVVAPLWAETPQPASSSSENDAARSLEIRQVAPNPAQGPSFAVQVADDKGAPVSDAAVLFRLPDTGDSGTFADGARSAVVYTDALGRAQVSGIHWNQATGPVTIRITATKGASHAGILIEQALGSSTAPALASAVTTASPAIPGTLAPTKMAQQDTSSKPEAATAKLAPAVSVSSTPPGQAPHASHKKWLILAIVAAAAGAGVAMAGKGKSGSSASTAPSLSIGTPSISLGH